MKQALLERLHKLSIPEPNSGCWLWLGVLSRKNGYGSMKINGRPRGAHRVSYEVHSGPIENGQHVLHRCDQPCCVNPDHLFLGTQASNMSDKAAKGRDTIGEKNSQAKLTEGDVRKIRMDGRTAKAIAADYGVSLTTIWEVKNRVWWQHVR